MEVFLVTKILIIDDEALVRIGLKSIINWNEIGCEVIGESENGIKGLELIERLKPDIVITDLKMPLMDGISMMKSSIEKSLKVKFVIISSFDDFSLVKEAMKLGAEDYLIKLEINPDLLKDTIKNIQKKIEKENYKNKKIQKINRQSVINKNLAIKNFFLKLINELFIYDAEILKSIENLDLNLDKNIICIVIRIWHYDKDLYSNGKDKAFLNFCIENIATEITSIHLKPYVINVEEKIYAVIASKDIKNSDSEKELLTDIGNRIIDTLNNYVNIKSSIGISKWFENLACLKGAYLEACKSLEKSFFENKSNIYFFEQNIKFRFDEVNIEKELLNVKTSLEFNDIKELKAAMNEIIKLFKNSKISEKQVKDLSCQFFYKIKELVKEYDIEIQKDYLSNNIYEGILSKNTLNELILQIEDVYLGLSDYLINERCLSQSEIVLRQVKNYVENHISEDIKLNDICNFVNMSNSYFSTFFKKYTGDCFSDYLTKEKIIRAKKFLLSSNYKIYEISQMLGYENPYYFSRVFKKIVGSTPKEYRECKKILFNYIK
jgi:two-component system response regulator YesN